MRVASAFAFAVGALAGCTSLACLGPFDIVHATWREPGLFDRLPGVVAQDVILLQERIVPAGLPLADEGMAREWGRYQVSAAQWTAGADAAFEGSDTASVHRGREGEARVYASVVAPADARATLDALLANVTTLDDAARARVADAALANATLPAGESVFTTYEAELPRDAVDLAPLVQRLGGRAAAQVDARENAAQLDWPRWRMTLELPSRSALVSHDYAGRTTTDEDGVAPDYDLSASATDHVWLQRVGQAPIAMDEAELRQWVVERFAHMRLPPPALDGWRVTRPSCE